MDRVIGSGLALGFGLALVGARAVRAPAVGAGAAWSVGSLVEVDGERVDAAGHDADARPWLGLGLELGLGLGLGLANLTLTLNPTITLALALALALALTR